jgi:anti-sigma B factor antagonist
MALKIDSQALESGIQVLTLSGDLRSGKESQYFEWFVNDLIDNHKNRIVIDMSGVGYMDSSGIGILVACHSRVTTAGGRFRLTGIVPRVAKLLRITGVDRVLTIDATPQDAVAAATV